MMTPLEDAEPYRMTVAEYMASDAPDNSELVEGIVYLVSPTNSPHRHAVTTLHRKLTLALGEKCMVQVEGAVAVTGWLGKNAPEVDIAILDMRYYERLPTAADAHACIEVSDTTYRDDRRVKIPMYVAAGIPAWIVNIAKRRVEEYAAPADLALANGRTFHDGEAFLVAGVAIDVTSILPPLSP